MKRVLYKFIKILQRWVWKQQGKKQARQIEVLERMNEKIERKKNKW